MTHTVRMYVCAVSALVLVHKYQPWVVFSAVPPTTLRSFPRAAPSENSVK